MAILSIGVFVVPFAVAAAILAARRRGRDSEAIGVMAGIGMVGLYVALIHLGAHAHCPSSGGSGSCEEFDIRPWLVAGVTLVLAGFGVFLVARRRAV